MLSKEYGIGNWGRLLYLFPILFLIIFFIYPLANIIRLSLTQEAFVELASRYYYLETFLFTFWQAALSTLLTLIVSLPAAYIFARYEFPAKSLLRALITVPFVLPTVVVAAAFRALLGPAGPLAILSSNLFGPAGGSWPFEQSLLVILLAHVYYNVAVVIRLIGGFWANLDPRMADAARVLGASPFRAFFEITLPQLRTPILSASVLIFLFTFTSFGVILLLGGPAYSTVETEIYRQYVTFLQPDIAAVLSLLQIVFTFFLMWLYAGWQRRAAVPLDFRAHKAGMRKPESAVEKIVISLMVVGLCAFMLSPMVVLAGRSLMNREGNFTLSNYRALPVQRRGSITFIPPLEAIRNSIGYAILTMLVAGALGLVSIVMLTRPTRWRKWLDPLFMLPLGASAVTLGFAYMISLGPLRTSPALVLIAHTLVALPFVVRALVPVVQGIKPNLREAAAVMGASPARIWREIDLPIIGRALLVAAAFAFTISMGEFGATSFIVRPNSGYLTMPVAIQRYLGQPGALNFGQAMAMGTILMIVCLAGFLAIERFRYADIGEF